VTNEYPIKGKRVWVTGHGGMVGAALVRRLAHEQCEILTVSRAEADLRDQQAVARWMKDNRPQAVFIAAAKVGGIHANDHYPAEFLYDNLLIEANVIDSARRSDVEKLAFLGSSCIYPKLAAQPMREEALLTGSLEPTNEWYAIAKIAGIKLCQAYRKQYGCNFISAMPTSLYGPGDNFDLDNSHVVPALMRKAHEAKLANAQSIPIWGTGTPRREFLHVDDCADGVVHLMKHYDGYDHVNVGFDDDLEIGELARMICRVVGFTGVLMFDPSRPDGTPRKLMSSARLRAMGWEPSIPLEEGLRTTYQWFLDQQDNLRRERA
jgi:GDP-L-fucose synthase